jgi:quinoprotein dehydrogenase-associated probable ABC transporter substrate-binding protein
MFSRCLSALLLFAIPSLAADQRVLRVCADPNNLPFSNDRGEGFENKLAEVVAADLGAKLEYVWWSERKSFIKNSLDQGRCDAVMGVPATLESVSATKPYYRSTYVFVSRRDRNLRIVSLDDPRLESLRIGIHVVGDDYAPPAYALARRGVTANIVGFSLFGEYGEPNPAAKIMRAVAASSIDLAIVWGPLAGYFAKDFSPSLDIAPVSPPTFLAVPFTYAISVGVHKGNETLKNEIDTVLRNDDASIQQMLAGYGVPLVH